MEKSKQLISIKSSTKMSFEMSAAQPCAVVLSTCFLY